MTDPIDVTVNADFLRPYDMALFTQGLNAVDDPERCVEYLAARCELPDSEAQRIVAALQEMGAGGTDA